MVSLTSRKLSPNVSQRPSVHVAPRADSTFGDLAAKFAADYGLKPDEWQRFVLDDWLGQYRSKWSALTCGLVVPRQNGKNALLEMREIFGMVGLGERILHTAHEVKTAQKHFRRLKFFFGTRADDPGAKYPELNALVEQVRAVNGQEAIILKNGGSVELVARSKNSGRGFTVDVLVMDEAQELSESELEALMPTTSAAPSGNPQWIFTGTPPGPSASGEVFTRVRQEALGAKPGRLVWHEWSAAPDVDLDDRDVWRATNPGIDSGRLQLDVIEGERARFSDGGFARERLGVWDADRRTISPLGAVWPKLAVEPEHVPVDGARAYGVAFSADGMRLSLGGAIIDGDRAHVEQIDAFAGAVEGGLAPLADWFVAKVDGAPRWRRASAIVLSGRAGAGVLEQLLLERKVPKRRIILPSTTQYFQSSAMLLNSAREAAASVEAGAEPSLTHTASEGQAALDASAAVAIQEKRARDGAWGWAAPAGDETPVESISLALWGARTARKPRKSSDDGTRKGVIL